MIDACAVGRNTFRDEVQPFPSNEVSYRDHRRFRIGQQCTSDNSGADLVLTLTTVSMANNLEGSQASKSTCGDSSSDAFSD